MTLFGNRIHDGTKEGFHTSGHADVETLKQVIRIVLPTLGVIPIHKDADSDMSPLYAVDGCNIITESATIGGINITIKD